MRSTSLWASRQPTAESGKESIRFQRISSAELDTTNYELTYLVDDILVDQQPCLMAGPHKSLKTNVLVDLSISLAIGGRFLGVFNVPRPVRVGVMSGESGLATLQETGRRIARAAGTRLSDIDNLIWTPDLPVFGHLDYMAALQEFIKARRAPSHRHRPRVPLLRHLRRTKGTTCSRWASYCEASMTSARTAAAHCSSRTT